MSNENQSNLPDSKITGHPEREQWMSYLYGEMDAQRQVALREHLRACPACREQVAGWEGMRQNLDKWKVSPARKTDPERVQSAPVSSEPAATDSPSEELPCAPAAPPAQKRPLPFPLPFQSHWRWAAAAGLVLGLTFLAGWGAGALRATGPSAEWADDFRAALRAELKEELQADWDRRINPEIQAATQRELKAWLKEFESLRQARDQALVVALDELESRHDAQLTQLRRELETVALLTAETFQQAQWRITQLAAWAETEIPE